MTFDEMRSYIGVTISQTNVVKSEKFSEIIQGVMNRYLNGMLTNEEVIEELLYPPEGMDEAVTAVMQQCELWTDNSDMNCYAVSYVETFEKKTRDLQMAAEENMSYGTKKEE